MTRSILIFPLLIAATAGIDAIDDTSGPPPKRARQAVSILTTYVTVRTTPELQPPMAQPGDLASYDGSPVDAVSAADMTSTDSSALPPDSALPSGNTIDTATLPPSVLSSILSAASETHKVLPTVPIPIFPLTGSTTSSDPASLTANNPANPPSTSALTTPPSNLPSELNTEFNLSNPSSNPTSALAAASAAMESCAAEPGGIRPDGAIDQGCKSFFDHINTCFTAGGPWETPYDEARNQAYRACVCMVSDANPFSEYSALWKNFSGCAACIFGGVGERGLDIEPWAIVEVRRLHSFCRSQEPDAFLFNHFLRNWFFKLGDYLSITAEPMSAAFQTTSGMVMLGKHYTGRPPLANLAWGPSALPSWEFEHVSPSMTGYSTTVEVRGQVVMTSASRLVTWVPTESGVVWDEEEADKVEWQAAEKLLHDAVCLGGGPCEKSGGVRLGTERRWVWAGAVAVAVVVGGAAVWL